MTTTSTLRSIVLGLALALVAGCQSSVPPAPTGLPSPTAAASGATSTSTPPAAAETGAPMGLKMSNLRAQPTATLLKDGRVLVAGGYRGDGSNNTADVFDPSINSFRPSGRFLAARYWHTATLLNDGRVALIGGTGSGRSPVSLVEVWDPATDAFTSVGELPEPRTLHTATMLLDGRVLVVGGVTPSVEPMASALLWDPATGQFTPAGNLVHPRAWHTAARLPDGRVLIAGGPAEAEIWDPATMSFSPAGALATPRWWPTATALADGRVIVIGGFEGEAFDAAANVVASAEMWNPATSAFAPAGSLAVGRALHAAVLLSDGRIIVIGGTVSAGKAGITPTVTVEIWNPSIKVADPTTITFTDSTPLREARQGETATLLADGRILVAGGSDGRDVGIGTAELLGPFVP